VKKGYDDTEAYVECVHGSVALLDQEVEDGCFSCWPDSHRHREMMFAGVAHKTATSFTMNQNQLKALESAGLSRLRVPVKKGGVILWRSDLSIAALRP